MFLKVKKNEAGIRLDKFLVEKFPEYSRGWLQKIIQNRGVLINNREVMNPSYILKKDDRILTKIYPPEKISLEPDFSIKFNIIYEDRDIVVIDKPAGLVIHPSNTCKAGTLVNALLGRWPDLKNVGENKLRPGIVHRLDKDTSGLLIVTKNNQTFKYLKDQFQKRKIEKHYIALVTGQIKEERGIIKKPIERSKRVPIKQKTIEGKNETKKSKKAETAYKVIERFKDYTLLEAIPKTGRMHQIRVHFASIGHPLAGDKKYTFKRHKYPVGLARHFLHANYLKFKLPNGKMIELESKLPRDLDEFLDKLKNN